MDTGLSISESDNNDALLFNPAGLAIDHGSNLIFMLFKTKIQSKKFLLVLKTKGFGIGYENNNR